VPDDPPRPPEDLARRQATVAATLVDEWVRCGVRHAVICPGSRSTPMALALAARPEIQVAVRLDERSAAFSALGVGLAGVGPAVLVTTSGTAATEVHAAVVEAHQAGVPLLVVSADRPAELQRVGAPQTVEQAGLYGASVRFAVTLDATDPGLFASWRSFASRLVLEARCHPSGPGPVHLNLAFREPLVGEPGCLPPGRPGGGPWHRALASRSAQAVDGQAVLAALGLEDGWVPGVVVAGEGSGPPTEVVALAEALGWPLLADARSGCRRPGRVVVGAADGILRHPGAREALRPRAVLRLGQPWLSKALGAFLDELDPGVPQVVLDRDWAWRDPSRRAVLVGSGDPTGWVWALVEALGARASDPRSAPDPTWLERWRRAERAAQGVVDEHLRAGGPPTVAQVARLVLRCVPPEATVLCSASLPVRGVEWYGPVRPDPPRVLANRGANGIDGVVSTARGLAMTGRAVVALVGDLAFLHDLTAWLEPARWPAASRNDQVEDRLALTVVVLDNGGGGIFSHLAQAEVLPADRFEALFATPQRQQVREVCAGLGVPLLEVGELAELPDALSGDRGRGPRVVRVVMPPADQERAILGALHEQIGAAVEAALGPAAGGA
jgi:2-succinyl-5-enolpyruvyl-6-hydroxy-3-cyclohexene-1-carboxylate synthase